MKTIICFLLTTLLFASCATSNHVNNNRLIQKRKYTRGWFAGGARTPKSSQKHDEVAIKLRSDEQQLEKMTVSATPALLSTSAGEEVSMQNRTTVCDTIYRKNGDVQVGEVKGVGAKVVGVKLCNTTRRVKSRNIGMHTIDKICYANGAKEDPNERPKPHGGYMGGGVMLIILGVFGLLVAALSFLLVGWETYFLIAGFIFLALAVTFLILGVRLIQKSNRLKQELKDYKEEKGLEV